MHRTISKGRHSSLCTWCATGTFPPARADRLRRSGPGLPRGRPAAVAPVLGGYSAGDRRGSQPIAVRGRGARPQPALGESRCPRRGRGEADGQRDHERRRAPGDSAVRRKLRDPRPRQHQVRHEKRRDLNPEGTSRAYKGTRWTDTFPDRTSQPEQAATLKSDELNLFDSTVVAVSSVARRTPWRRLSACSSSQSPTPGRR